MENYHQNDQRQKLKQIGERMKTLIHDSKDRPIEVIGERNTSSPSSNRPSRWGWDPSEPDRVTFHSAVVTVRSRGGREKVLELTQEQLERVCPSWEDKYFDCDIGYE